MAEITYNEKNKRLLFGWVAPVFIFPRRIFQKISTTQKAIWITPLLILSFLVLVNVLVAGRIKNQAAMSGEITYPPDYQYWSPEQQAQYMQAIQSTQGPVFVYVLPAIAALIGVWIGWLILGGIMHFVTTLLGGRGSTVSSMNIVAWGSMPLALRALVQIIYMLVTNKLISSPGLSGFSPVGDSGGLIFVSQILKLLDVFIIWQVLLMILGIRRSTALSAAKSIFGVVLSVVIILLLKAGFSYATSMLSNLSITRPFFF